MFDCNLPGAGTASSYLPCTALKTVSVINKTITTKNDL